MIDSKRVFEDFAGRLRDTGRNACATFLAIVFSFSNAFAEPRQIETDLLIVGGTESGWAAAIQAARMDVKSITIVLDGEWLGGQYTEQSLACVDENKGVGKVGWGVDWHPMKRSFHRSGLFKELMDGIEAFNTEKYGSPMPGRPFHGPSTFRPAESEAVFRKLLQPYLDSGQVKLITNRYPVKGDVDESGDRPRLTGLTFAPIDLQTAESGEPDLHITAKMTIDASDWGDAIQVSGAAYECGPDPKSRYGEPSAPEDLSEFPANEMNPITWAMIVAQSDGETPISEPGHFDDRNYPRATHFSRAEFGALKWDRKPKIGSILHWPDGGPEMTSPRQLSVFTVRRIVDGYESKDGKTSILLNYMNGQDYALERLPQRVVDALEATEPGASKKNIVEMTRKQRQIVFDDAKRHSLGVLYHLQNFVHERAEDKTNSFRNFHLSDEFGTPDNLPPKPYIREGLRLKAMYMMREQDGRNRDGETKDAAKERFAHVMYPDGLFAWQFHYDFHRTGRTYLVDEGEDGPWIDYEKPGRHTRFVSDRSVFPLRSLIPEEMDGLLGAQGNVGFSSIVSAAIRLHDQRVHIGQASGATAAVSLRKDVDPREIVYDRGLLEEVRDGLCSEEREGVPLLIWPFRDLKPEDPWFVAGNRLAAFGAYPVEGMSVDLFGEKQLDSGRVEEDREWLDGITGPAWEAMRSWKNDWWGLQITTRGASIDWAWRVHWRSKIPGWDRESSEDADGDGIPDRDDALLFTPNEPIVWEIEREKLTPETDGLVGEEIPSTGRRFDFAGKGVPEAEGFERDSGAAFTDDSGFGWGRDLSANFRRRNAVPETYRDTFLFTRDKDTWECQVENGRYRVTVCVGDSGHEQVGQNVSIEGKLLVENEKTAAGRFLERAREFEVKDGRLTVTIGQSEGKTANTCLNWLAFERLDSAK